MLTEYICGKLEEYRRTLVVLYGIIREYSVVLIDLIRRNSIQL